MPEMSLDELKRQAELAGLTLNEEEAAQLLPGVNRNRRQAETVRSYLADHEETPAFTFEPLKRKEA